MTRRLRTALAMLCLMVFGFGMTVAPISAQDTAESFPVQLYFVNAMTSLDSVDVYINGDDSEQRVIEGLAYGAVSEPFEGTAPGTVVLIKQNVSWGVDSYLFNVAVPTEAGKSYVVVISDFVIIPTEVDLSATGADEARSRGVHAASQAPSVDVYVTPAGDDPALGNVVPLITDLSYGRVTDGGPLPAGTYDITLNATGTDTVALEATETAVEAGMVYTYVLIGKPGSTEQPLTVLTVALPAQA